MNQQNQYQNISEGKIIQAPTANYPKRSFKLISLIGQGTEGKIFKAIPQDWGSFQNEVALKFQSSMKENSKNFYQLIIDYQNKYENVNSSNYCPSNVIRIYDSFEIQNLYIIVMELGSNDLYNYLKLNQSNLNLQQKSQICLQIISSIHFLHNQQHFHRDIKPENYVLVGQQVKLTDFGLIKQQINGCKMQTINIGTKLFQAPELIEGKSDYTMAVDIWAMGFVFYEIIKGDQLIDVQNAKELEQIVQNHISNQSFIYDKIDRLPISDVWKTTIKRMLNPLPNNRITAKEVIEILQKSSIIQNPINSLPIQVPPNQVKSNQNFSLQSQQTPLQQFQNNLLIQINNIIGSLQLPYTLNHLQQQKGTSFKILVSLKEQVAKVLNQLETSSEHIEQNHISDSSSENQIQIVRKQLPEHIKQKLDLIKIPIQEFEEKCISDQDYQNLDNTIANLKNEIAILELIELDINDKKKLEQDLKVKQMRLKEIQQLIIKQQIIEEEIKSSRNYNQDQQQIDQLQTEIACNQKIITQLEIKKINLKQLQQNKLDQENTIKKLQEYIDQNPFDENQLNSLNDQIYELKATKQILEIKKKETSKNQVKIQELTQQISNMDYISKLYQEQIQQIQILQNKIEEINKLEQKTKQQNEEILQLKAQLLNQPNLQELSKNQERQIVELTKEAQKLQQLQEKINDNFKEIHELTIKKNLKQLKEEELSQLNAQKQSLEQDQYKYKKTNPSYRSGIK